MFSRGFFLGQRLPGLRASEGRGRRRLGPAGPASRCLCDSPALPGGTEPWTSHLLPVAELRLPSFSEACFAHVRRVCFQAGTRSASSRDPGRARVIVAARPRRLCDVVLLGPAAGVSVCVPSLREHVLGGQRSPRRQGDVGARDDVATAFQDGDPEPGGQSRESARR